jgi:hypothetical protein
VLFRSQPLLWDLLGFDGQKFLRESVILVTEMIPFRSINGVSFQRSRELHDRPRHLSGP